LLKTPSPFYPTITNRYRPMIKAIELGKERRSNAIFGEAMQELKHAYYPAGWFTTVDVEDLSCGGSGGSCRLVAYQLPRVPLSTVLLLFVAA